MMPLTSLRIKKRKMPLVLGLIFVFVFASLVNALTPLAPTANALTKTEQAECYQRFNGKDINYSQLSQADKDLHNKCIGYCTYAGPGAEIDTKKMSCPDPAEPSTEAEAAANDAETKPLVTATCGTVPTSGENAINAWLRCQYQVRTIYYNCSSTGGGITGAGQDTPENTAACAVPKINALPGITKISVNTAITLIKKGRDDYNTIITNNALAKAKKECEDQGGTWSNSECTPKSAADDAPVCAAGALGWILCPLSELMQNSTKLIAEQLQKYLTFEPIIGSTSGKAIQAIWQSLLVISNVVLVIGLIVVIYSQATSAGLSNYGVKKMLPRLLVVAILMNLSFFICAIAVDASNIAGASIKGLVDAGFAALPPPPSGTQVGASNAQTGVAVIVGSISLVAVSAAGLLPLLFPVLISAVLTLFAALAIVVFRQIAIVILIIIAPLAFAAYLLPNTESWFTKWRKSFITLLFIYPVIMAIFYGSALVSRLIITTATTGGAGAGVMTQIIALAVLIVPLFSLPFILKSAGGILDRFGAMVNNRNKGFVDRARKRGQSMSANSNFQRARAARKAETTARRNREFYKRMSGDGFGVRKGMGQLGISGYGTQFATKGGRADVHMTGANIGDQYRKQQTEETARTLAGIVEKGGFSPGSYYTVVDKNGNELVKRTDNHRAMVAAALDPRNAGSSVRIENAAGEKTMFKSGEIGSALMSQTAKMGDVPLTQQIIDLGNVSEDGKKVAAGMREFVSYNAGNYATKAPDYVKGAKGAFGKPRASEVVGWHDDTSKRAAAYVNSIQDEKERTETAANISNAALQVLSNPNLRGQMAPSSLKNIMRTADGGHTDVYKALKTDEQRAIVDNFIDSGGTQSTGGTPPAAGGEVRIDHTGPTPPGGTTPGGLYIPTAAETARSPRPRSETPPPTGGGGSTPPPPPAPTSYTQGGAQIPGSVQPGDDAAEYLRRMNK